MMLTYQKLKNIFPTLNEKPLCVEEFFRVASEKEILVFEIRLKKRGYCVYDFDESQDYVFLKKGLSYIKWLETAYHELFHVCGCDEFEANAFRLVALIPLQSLIDYSFLEDNPTPYAKRLFREREKLWFLYGV